MPESVIDTATPLPGWQDTLVRAVKTAVTTAVGVLGVNLAGWTNLTAAKAAGIAAASAALSVILNKVLQWSNS